MARNRKQVFQALKKHGLGQFAPLIADSLIPAVRVIPGKPTNKLPVGVSKFGGDPDLHSPDDWPHEPAGRPLQFVGQIQLSDLPSRHIPRTLLPRRGWLWFWYDQLGWQIDLTTGRRCDWETSGFQVTFSASESRPLVRCPCPAFPEPKFFRRERLRRYDKPPALITFPQAPVRLEPLVSIDHKACDRFHSAINRSREDFGERAINFYSEAFGADHQLLGDTDEYGSDMRESCELALAARSAGVRAFDYVIRRKISERRKSQWRLLMAFGTDGKLDWLWGDGGALCYWIRQRDLARRDFSHVHGMIEP